MSHPPAALRRILTAGEQWSGLAGLEEHLIGHVVTGKERVQSLFQLAALRQDKLGDVPGTIEALERLLDASPDSREALTRLKALHREREAWDDVEAVFQRWLGVASGDEAASVRFRLAVLLLELRGDRAGALEAAAAVLAHRSRHAPAVLLCEEVLEHTPAGDPDRVAIRNRATDLLERTYLTDAPWRRWEVVYQAQLEAATDPEHRMLLHSQGLRTFKGFRRRDTPRESNFRPSETRREGEHGLRWPVSGRCWPGSEIPVAFPTLGGGRSGALGAREP